MGNIKKAQLFSTISMTLGLLTACSEGTYNDDNSPELIISEIVAKANDDGSDWIELKNISDTSLTTEHYSLMDAGSELATELPNVQLEPGEFLIIEATGESAEESNYTVPFKLGSEDSVTLLYQQSEVDRLSWKEGDAKKGRSYGVYNGDEQTLHPTRGSSNAPHNLFIADEVITVKLNLSEDNWQAILDNPTAEEYQKGSVNFNGITMDNVEEKCKLYASWNNPHYKG